jgi:glutamate synthase (NADPH/NADH) small chain
MDASKTPQSPRVVYSTEPEDFRYIGINVPCQDACPAFTNIPAYIRALFEERYGQSYEINRLANIFPGVLGRVCSRPCEDKCRHGEPELGKPVNICHIKRAAADLRKRDFLESRPKTVFPDKKVAIIGAGPAGLAAAHDLVTIGMPVTILEAMPEPGGMLIYGIPEFRLPRSIVKEEIDRILQLGVELKTDVRVGRDVPMEELLREFAAVLLAAGCYRSNRLEVEGENLSGVYPGLEFMMDVCQGGTPTVGKRVLVIGAGYTAFDCARSSLRLGALDVSICLRRTEGDLVVTGDEVSEAKKEGVKIQSLMLARRIIGNGGVEGVEFVRTSPGEPTAEGKRKISPIEGSEFILPADTVIVATGQTPEQLQKPGGKPGENLMLTDKVSYRTAVPGLYAAGDYLTGSSTVIEALARGRWAAEQIARDLIGMPFREQAVRMEDTVLTDRQRFWDYLPRQEMPTVRLIDDRLSSPDLEVETGFGPEAALEEAKRCYLCYLHYEIDIDTCIYCRYCIDEAPRDCIKMVKEIRTDGTGAIVELVETSYWVEVNAIVIDNSRCIRCGECVRVCPVDCISVTRVEQVERMLQTEEGHG